MTIAGGFFLAAQLDAPEQVPPVNNALPPEYIVTLSMLNRRRFIPLNNLQITGALRFPDGSVNRQVVPFNLEAGAGKRLNIPVPITTAGTYMVAVELKWTLPRPLFQGVVETNVG